jgi:hypothetical protein
MADQPVSKTGYKDQLALLTFVDNLIRERKDPRVNETNMPQIRELLLKQINEAVNRHLITLLSDKDQAELSTLLDKNVSDDELNVFFKEKILNFEVEMTAALLNFRTAYLYSAQPQPKEAIATVSAPKIVEPPPMPAARDDLGPPPPPAPVK